MAKKATVLITGGAGFIGSHTGDALLGKGYKVKILDSLEPPIHQNHRWPKYVQNKSYELIKGDIRNKKTIERSLRGVSYVYHIAAYQDQRPDFSKFFETNVLSSALLYEIIAAKKLPVKKIILASTQFIYGDGEYSCPHSQQTFFPEVRPLKQFQKKDWSIKCPHGSRANFHPFKENQKLMPTNSYGLSKQAMENLGLRLGKTYSIPTTILRYSIVQGPRQSPFNLYSGAIRIFVSQSLAGVPITVYEDGEQTRDFVNIRDVVRANLLALNNKKTDFEIYNVGGGRAWKVLDFANLVKKITGATSPILISGFRRTDTREAISDISKIKKLGWRPKFSTEDSIKSYVEWFQKEKFTKQLNLKYLKRLKLGIKN
ncbi:MAG: GDP-mannose 4,6-dehydratase [Candidatus Liptonbacteria bacterium]|nr:GDP-mannose 4,6-dehydratase [Candidatus Liptonbacteria bacterium]